MNWEQLLSVKRTGQPVRPRTEHDRTQFQRDYDRLIFSSPFRRMQDKTQVFPLPGSIFVHNRLTHSLEVASVGRSLGNNISKFLKEKLNVTTPLVEELGAVTAAACLAHDMGNPPFGHSGEKAISIFFKNGEGAKYVDVIDNAQIVSDFTDFEGNANALRLLTHQFTGRRNGGFGLTYTTLASIIKYPYPSGMAGKKKYGYFKTEERVFLQIADELGLPVDKSDSRVFARHPLVFLVEAADDICYQLMDIEDAHKLGILSFSDTRTLFLSFFDSHEDSSQLRLIQDVEKEVTDTNELLAFMRALVIGKVVGEVTDIFIKNHDNILNGSFNSSLIKKLGAVSYHAMEQCKVAGRQTIYVHPSVVEVEIAGFKILGTLLKEFCSAVMNPGDYYSSLLLPFIPQQFRVDDSAPVYKKIQTVLDFVSSMTDVYALDLYRKINGMGLSDKRVL
ncbi:dNTP triphosphohydrolase [Marinilabiliaceae bacterium ANBcel2]|nr:dNTP triphosphohydrolase [Marinilabiliaceae bacterium ANBcel2]